jgi:UDP-glucose 4-epimerase
MLTCPINPYGRTKLYSEQIIIDFARSWADFKYILLRYFNPVGAHPSGLLGESSQTTPSNLMPYIADVAIGKREKLFVFGDDWETHDGTGVRDFIHVVDLAEAHIAALNYLMTGGLSDTINLGTGRGYSVFELIQAYETVSKKIIPYEIVSRRIGDVGSSFADVTLAKKLLNWQSKRDINIMCKDSWKFISLNPFGY